MVIPRLLSYVLMRFITLCTHTTNIICYCSRSVIST
jgi:hypothetical protein